MQIRGQPLDVTQSSLNSSNQKPPRNQSLPNKLYSAKGKAYLKKRIGPYSYNYNKIIGHGVSSFVYEAKKDHQPGMKLAIKVIKLSAMSALETRLLQTEIKIMKQLSHPNVLHFEDAYFTNNNCYIVTEFCEGGTLQRYIEENDKVECGDIIAQIAEGCKYLSEQMIVHRDIKPANIMLRQGTWKIGDFGFAYQLSGKNYKIMQKYRIGSPFFMPPETLQLMKYSLKSDAFALGVLIHYTLNRSYPWSGNSIQDMIESYQNQELNSETLSFLPLKAQEIIKQLLQLYDFKRASIEDCDFSIFLPQNLEKETKQVLHSLDEKLIIQVNLCQFLHYFIKNCPLFLEEGHQLKSFSPILLASLTAQFDWSSKPSLNEILTSYPKISTPEPFSRELCLKIKKVIDQTIKLFLSESVLSNKASVGIDKMFDYLQLVKYLLSAESEKFMKYAKGLMLHRSYQGLVTDRARITEISQQFEFVIL